MEVGIYLTVFPLKDRRELVQLEAYPVATLRCGQDYAVYGQFDRMAFLRNEWEEDQRTLLPLLKLHPLPVQLGLMVPHVGDQRTILYGVDGESLTFLYAEEFGRLVIPGDCSQLTKAALSYIRELEDDTPVVFYWH